MKDETIHNFIPNTYIFKGHRYSDSKAYYCTNIKLEFITTSNWYIHFEFITNYNEPIKLHRRAVDICYFYNSLTKVTPATLPLIYIDNNELHFGYDIVLSRNERKDLMEYLDINFPQYLI